MSAVCLYLESEYLTILDLTGSIDVIIFQNQSGDERCMFIPGIWISEYIGSYWKYWCYNISESIWRWVLFVYTWNLNIWQSWILLEVLLKSYFRINLEMSAVCLYLESEYLTILDLTGSINVIIFQNQSGDECCMFTPGIWISDYPGSYWKYH